MDRPPQLFVARISKLGSILYLHKKWKSEEKRPLVIDLVITLLLLPENRLLYVLMLIPLKGFLHLEKGKFILWLSDV